MDKQVAILRLASDLFDVAGAVGNILILGLETHEKRDLDAFQTDGHECRFPGFHKYFGSRIAILTARIDALDHTAKQLHYANGVNLKQLAVIAGLGGWGKNSMVIHPKFGPRLRFVALELDLAFATEIHDKRTQFSGCANCDACIRACPLGALQPFAIPDKTKCQAFKDLTDRTKTHRCNLCQIACPAGR